MTRQELLAIAKPILFNTEMVRALLGGNKTVIRRVVKKKYVDDVLSSPARIDNPDVSDKRFVECLCESPYQVSDYLYVRETYQEKPIEIGGGYFYKEEAKEPNNYTWKPSIHMPKEAARIFLRVTDVRVEKAWDISEEQAIKEGCPKHQLSCPIIWFKNEIIKCYPEIAEENKWVWVIEFERIETE